MDGQVSIEMERWRGETEARIRDAERRLDAINGNIARGAEALQALTLGVAEHRSTIRTWGLVGTMVLGIMTPVATGCLVYFITH